MDNLAVNKICAAVLLAGITFVVPGLLGDALVHPKELKKLAITIDMPEAAGAAAPPAADPPVALLLASADPKAGEALVGRVGCVACHSFNDGGKAGVGPNLYGVVGAPHGHMPGFAYSDVLKAKAGPWTFDELYTWLKKPSAYAPGTKMSFAGLENPKQRADIIDYLRTLSPNPEPLPPAPAAAPAAPGPSAGGPAAGQAVQGASFDTMLAAADPKAGMADTAKLGCVACHSFNDGGKAGLGPNLYGVVGGPHAHMVGFDYSAGMKAKTGPWTFDELNTWLTKPAAYVPGTKMTFAGIPDEKTRADVIAYLRSLSATPVPLPAAK